MNIEFNEKEIKKLKQLISNFNFFYENENDVWNFADLEDQRQLACEIVKILINKI
ncbi:MAG: hypothetical protein LBR17_08305 [Bacteroidales bacterium]|jgi:hypothetical protein|nr:hypothetical protein [Bacteroidales bacterium]